MGDTQQYRFSTGCRRLEAGAFSGSLGGHDSAAGLNNDNAGSRDRIQPDNPAAIERDIKSTIDGSETGSKYAETGWLGKALVERYRNQLFPLRV
jgi:hypothetical protein